MFTVLDFYEIEEVRRLNENSQDAVAIPVGVSVSIKVRYVGKTDFAVISPDHFRVVVDGREFGPTSINYIGYYGKEVTLITGESKKIELSFFDLPVDRKGALKLHVRGDLSGKGKYVYLIKTTPLPPTPTPK